MKRHLITLLFALAPLANFAQNPNAASATQSTNWKTLKDPAYQINYPPDWELKQEKSSPTSFVLFARGVDGKFRENVNLMVQDLTGYNLDLAAYVKLSEEQITTAMANGKIVSSRPVTNDGVTRHEIIYQGDFNQYKLKWKQYYWVKNNTAYVLTFTATQETYDEFLYTADRILNSFVLTN